MQRLAARQRGIQSAASLRHTGRPCSPAPCYHRLLLAERRQISIATGFLQEAFLSVPE